ncbi:MAG TPA: type II toxin-antitoxin system HigB family toxin [Bacteroidia bacterium]|nr:type II toxin-antitoxin system HigB family toxin [Bacteroidia bacterium]
MKVHLVKEQTIRRYIEEQARGRSSFNAWLSKVFLADWEKPEDIRKTFASADFLGNGSSRIVFDIGGNNYRMIAKYAFGESEVHLFVCWIGTHAEYDKLCDSGEQYIRSDY